jgi:hypothetical protein
LSTASSAPESPRIPTALLRRAVAIYLERAYPSGERPEAVARRLTWCDGGDEPLDLGKPPFERANRPEAGVAPIVALRLGNERFPHMKLQIQPWPNAAGFLLSVNTHDQILSLSAGGPEADAARALQAYNQQLKEAIELAWDQEGLPTFLRYLRDYLHDQHGGPPPEIPSPAD